MVYTQKIKRAIKFSIKTHEVYQKQKRKNKDIAYITHPLTVGIILSLVGANENVICAGILHDTIEDSVDYKKVDAGMLAERFGREVADLVVSVTEVDRSLPWEDRKADALSHIWQFSEDSLLVKSADTLSNTSELIDDYTRYGESIFDQFSASKEKMLAHYRHVIEAILERWRENPLADDLKKALVDLTML
ncbi:HD domain-containing protein [Candidatus Falkowbacteria bacterium]|nr:HD domain-containing protein [Candidatus Falkowbacteria bacterium]